MATVLRACAVPILAVLGGCGANYREAAEGDAEFSRCTSADRDDTVSRADRLQCWETWQQYYGSTATPERLRYARSRAADLTQSRRPSTTPATTPDAAASASRTSSGGDTSAANSRVSAPAQPAAPDPGAGGDPPGSECAASCRQAWQACSGGCAATAPACVARCDDSYRDCARGCY